MGKPYVRSSEVLIIERMGQCLFCGVRKTLAHVATQRRGAVKGPCQKTKFVTLVSKSPLLATETASFALTYLHTHPGLLYQLLS